MILQHILTALILPVVISQEQSYSYSTAQSDSPVEVCDDPECNDCSILGTSMSAVTGFAVSILPVCCEQVARVAMELLANPPDLEAVVVGSANKIGCNGHCYLTVDAVLGLVETMTPDATLRVPFADACEAGRPWPDPTEAPSPSPTVAPPTSAPSTKLPTMGNVIDLSGNGAGASFNPSMILALLGSCAIIVVVG